jgi:hypothetical protein
MKKFFLSVSFLTLVITGFGQVKIASPKTTDQLLNEKYCGPLFSTADATYFDMLDTRNISAQGYTNILDWLQGRVAGLRIFNTSPYTRVAYIRNQKAAVYIDEMPVTDDFVNNIPVADIAMIKIIKDPFISGWRGPGGVIAIYTIRGDEDTSEE